MNVSSKFVNSFTLRTKKIQVRLKTYYSQNNTTILPPLLLSATNQHQFVANYLKHKCKTQRTIYNITITAVWKSHWNKTKLKTFVFIEFTPDSDYRVSLSVYFAIADTS